MNIFMETMELFNSLESNEPHVAEQIKKRFHENFNASKESWILNGLFDYFVQTNSIRSVEIIVSAREPHDKHLYDRIDDGLKQPIKLQALTLLGHVVRRQPPWIYKITQHPLLKNLLKLLKTETEILPLMSALLIIIILLPMIPANIDVYLNDLFEIFSRLAAWNRNNPGKLADEQLVHLQVGMYALFLRLYGMYPCNFLSYLRQTYGRSEHLTIFSHTIKPMLDTVKMHPLLVTASKDSEISTMRWKKMEHHDVIVECAKLTLDPTERLREDTFPAGLTSSFRSRSGTDYNSGILDSSYSVIQPSCFPSCFPTGDVDLFSPSLYFQHSTSPPASDISVTTASIPPTPNAPRSTPQAISASVIYPHQEGTSPPEAAVEATPETTPIKDLRVLSTKPVPPNSTVVRALTNFQVTKWGDVSLSVSSQSQPSSPMKKDVCTFKFPSDLSQHSSAFEQPVTRRDASSTTVSSALLFDHHNAFISQKVSRLMHDRSVINENSTISDRSTISNLRCKTPLNHPTSPLRVITSESSVPNSPVPIETTAPTPGAKDWHVAKPKPEKNGFRFESPSTQDNITQEDQEVVEIVRRGEQYRNDSGVAAQQINHCDSVLQDFHPPHNEEFEECEQQLGSPCTMGGLHMPNSQSMIHLAKRLRYYSQCMPDTSPAENEFSTGSSPNDRLSSIESSKVRRANSCPEMKKGFSVIPVERLKKNRILSESEEENNSTVVSTTDEDEKQQSWTNGGVLNNTIPETEYTTIGVQTIDVWPQPYEHLFLDLIPTGITTTAAGAPAAADFQTETSSSSTPMLQNSVRFSPYEMLDRFIETSKKVNDKDCGKRMRSYEMEVKLLREQLELVHLQVQFERHRRDVHSERNRRLIGKAKNNRALEEYNIALRDQLALLQKEIESLRFQLENKNKETILNEKKLHENIDYWQRQCIKLEEENKSLKYQKETLEESLKAQNSKIISVNNECQQTQATLLDLRNEMHFAVQQAIAGEQLRNDLEQLQKEHVLLGELQLKYQERLASISNLKCREDELQLITEAYSQEIENLNSQLLKSSSLIESLKSRNNDLENMISNHDEACAEQKRMLKTVKEEYQEELSAVEAKYNTQRAIIKRMEENILELHTRIDRFEYVSRRVMRSPVSMSSGRDIGSGERPGPSPHSSPPLSVSLTSSEGGTSMAFLQTNNSSVPTNVEIKNLQVIVDQPEQQTSSAAGGEDAIAGCNSSQPGGSSSGDISAKNV